MEQIFRIEIPIEAVDKTDTAALQRLESTLQKIFTSMQKNKATAKDVFDAIEQGASEARSALQTAATAAESTADSYDEIAEAAGSTGAEQINAAQSTASAAEKLRQAISGAGQTYDEMGDAARQAGQKSGSAFTEAINSTDKFTQRVEKSNRTLRSMFREKFQLVLAAIDKASPILKSVATTVKGLTAKAWNIAVRMTDFVTAPFRKLYNLISSPITMALSIVGVGFSASEVVSTYNDFETGMSGVRALTGATNEEFLLLKETAKELGADTSFSASEAAEGMQNLASAGFTTSEIVAAMPGMLDLAASSGEDLAVASDIAATTLRGFGLEASEAAHVADVLAEAAARTNANVADTGEAMKYIAPIANTMGLKLEEVAAAIGLLSDAGIKGSQAGTTLRGALSRLAKPTEDMLEVMDDLNLSFYEDGQMKSLSGIVGMLKNNMADLTDEQRQSALVTLFGQEALSGMLVLMEGGSEKIDALRESLESCEGAASEMAKVRLDNLAGDMEELGGAVETAKLDIMEKLDPYLRQAVQWLTAKIPIIQQKLEDMIDIGIAKATELKDFVADVFGGSDFQSADGFVEKFFVAWDKIIAEPFNNWWSGGGKEMILGKLAEFGEGAGNFLRGIAAGIFAAFKGEDVDLAGLDMTGIAAAGLEAAKSFASSFIAGLDLGGLMDEMPGIIKAGLFGYGTLKIGQGGSGIYKTISGLKSIFSGLTTAASTATPAINAIGTASATSALGIGKAATMLGGLKAALAAIPVWGWVAAAAVAASATGIKLYTDAQERNRQELLHFSDAGAEAAEKYRDSAKAYREYTDALNSLQVQSTTMETTFQPVDEATINATIAGLEVQSVELQAAISDEFLPETERAIMTAKILAIDADRIALEFTTKEMSEEERQAINSHIQTLDVATLDIETRIAEGGLSETEVAALEEQIANLQVGKIALEVAVGNTLTTEEVNFMIDQLDKTQLKKVELEAQLASGGLDPDDVAALEAQIADLNTREVVIETTLGMLSNEEVAQYAAQQLDIDYGALVELSGGVITQADVDAGRITEEDANYVKKHLLDQAETDLYNLLAETQRGREALPNAIAMRDMYQGNAEYWASQAGETYSDAQFLGELEDRRASALAKYNAGVLDDDALLAEGTAIANAYKERFGEGGPINSVALGASPELMFGEYGGGLLGTGLFGHFIADEDAATRDIFRSAIESLQGSNTNNDAQQAASTADYQQQNAMIVQQYQNEKALIEGFTFQGTELAGMSLEEVAASYATLDEAGRKIFDDAVMALDALNAQTNYITDDEKTKAVDVVDLAAKAEIMQNVQTQVQDIATKYQSMTAEQQATFAASEEGAAQLAAVNTALDSLGLDKIESLDQLNGALEALAAVDLSTFTLEAANAAFTALGGDAEGCKTKVDALRAALQQIDGMATTSTHTHTNTTISKTITVSDGQVSVNANGGIYDGAMLSWVAEDGPEAIIPLGAKRRERGLQLWLQAGEMLGVAELADGGIMAPYAGSIESIPEDGWDGGSSALPSPTTTGGGANNITVSVSATPTFHIEGGSSSEDILDKLKAKQKELAEIFSAALAEQLEDIVSNMA